MSKMKKKLTLVLALAIIVAIAIGGTYAYLTDVADVTNTFSVEKLDIDLVEPNWDDDVDGDDLIPGDTLVKDPTLIADVETDSYVRIIMTITDNSGGANQGKVITDADRLALILKTIYYDSTYDVDKAVPATTTNIVEGKKYSLAQLASYPRVNPLFTKVSEVDGKLVYNYSKIYGGDEEIVFFTNAVVPTDWNAAEVDLLGKYTINLKAEAIQAANFANAAEAFAALDVELAPTATPAP